MKKYIEELLSLAKENVEKGGRPFACLIVKDTKVIAKTVNQFADGDPLGHAELIAIRQVVAEHGKQAKAMLKGAEFYVLSHPCPMCLTALYYVNASSVVFCTEREFFSQYFKAGYAHASYDTIYDEIGKHWKDRRLPMNFVHDHRVEPIVKRWRTLASKKLVTGRAAPAATENRVDSPSVTGLLKRLTRNLNEEMRHRYRQRIRQIGKATFPLIVATEGEPGGELSGVGAVYTLYLADGSAQRIAPASDTMYEVYKNIAHIPLLLWVTLECYTGDTYLPQGARESIDELEAKLKNLNVEIKSLTDLTQENKLRFQRVLQASLNYLALCKADNQLTAIRFKTYSEEVFPTLLALLKDAVKIQVEKTIEALLLWKTQLGPELWRELYAVVPTVWTVSEESPRVQCLRKVMEPATVDHRLITAEGITTHEQAKELIGRIRFDRLAAEMIFGPGRPATESKELVKSLSGRRDIASGAASQVLQQSKL